MRVEAPARAAPKVAANTDTALDGGRPDGALVAVRVTTEFALRLAPVTFPVETVPTTAIRAVPAEPPRVASGAQALVSSARAPEATEMAAPATADPIAPAAAEPTPLPTAVPTAVPTAQPTPQPTPAPTPAPTPLPTVPPPPPTPPPTPTPVPPTPTPPPVVTVTATPAPLTPPPTPTGGRFATTAEMVAALSRTPWPQETWGRLIAIAFCESGIDSDRDGQYDRVDTQALGAGGLYLGALQISREHRFRTAYNLLTLQDNLNAGYELWLAAGRSFRPWGCA